MQFLARMGHMKTPVSMKDIASALHVSIVTVSKALAGKEGVSEKLRREIVQEAERLGYRKNVAAADMRLGTSQNIGILTREHRKAEHEVNQTLLRGLIRNLSELNYYSIEEIVSKEMERTDELPKLASANKVEGIILAGFFKPSYVQKLQKTGIPILAVDFFSATGDDDSIICDNVYGSYLLTRHLVSLSHDKIIFVGNPLYDDNTMDRYLGYLKALKEQGLEEHPPLSDMDELGEEKDLSLVEDATAYVCSSSKTAYTLEKKIHAAGLSVPEDISVVCFDDDSYSQMASPSITAFHVNYGEMAYLASLTIVEKVAKKNHVGRKTISGKLVLRDSSGRPNNHIQAKITQLG